MTTKKFLDYEGLGKFWNVINTKFNKLFATKTELSNSSIVALQIGETVNIENPNSPLVPTIDIILGTTTVGEYNYKKYSTILPIANERNSGLITPSMAIKIENAITEVPEVPSVTSEKSGLMTPELLDKLNKSIQNRLLNDSSVTTGEDGNTYLNLTFEYSDGSEAVEKINVSDLVDTYIKGEGISIDNNVISIDNNWINDNININIETISEEEISNIVNSSN